MHTMKTPPPIPSDIVIKERDLFLHAKTEINDDPAVWIYKTEAWQPISCGHSEVIGKDIYMLWV